MYTKLWSLINNNVSILTHQFWQMYPTNAKKKIMEDTHDKRVRVHMGTFCTFAQLFCTSKTDQISLLLVLKMWLFIFQRLCLLWIWLVDKYYQITWDDIEHTNIPLYLCFFVLDISSTQLWISGVLICTQFYYIV